MNNNMCIYRRKMYIYTQNATKLIGLNQQILPRNRFNYDTIFVEYYKSEDLGSYLFLFPSQMSYELDDFSHRQFILRIYMCVCKQHTIM